MWRTGPNLSDRASAIARAVPGMEAMVEADLHSPTRRLGRARDPLDVLDPDARGLLDEDVRRRTEGQAGVLRELVVRHRDDHDVELLCEQLVERPTHQPAEPVGQRSSGRRVEVEAGGERVVAECGRALVADEPTADDADAKSGPRRFRCDHVYSAPKQPWNSKSNRSSGASAAAMASRVSSGRRA